MVGEGSPQKTAKAGLGGLKAGDERHLLEKNTGTAAEIDSVQMNVGRGCNINAEIDS